MRTSQDIMFNTLSNSANELFQQHVLDYIDILNTEPDRFCSNNPTFSVPKTFKYQMSYFDKRKEFEIEVVTTSLNESRWYDPNNVLMFRMDTHDSIFYNSGQRITKDSMEPYPIIYSQLLETCYIQYTKMMLGLCSCPITSFTMIENVDPEILEKIRSSTL